MTTLALDRRFRVSAAFSPEVSTGRFNKLHIGQSIHAGDFQAPHQLLGIELIKCAGPDRWVMTEDDAFDVLDDPDANDEPGADGERRAPGCQGADLEKGGVPVKGMGNAFSYRHLLA